MVYCINKHIEGHGWDRIETSEKYEDTQDTQDKIWRVNTFEQQ